MWHEQGTGCARPQGEVGLPLAAALHYGLHSGGSSICCNTGSTLLAGTGHYCWPAAEHPRGWELLGGDVALPSHFAKAKENAKAKERTASCCWGCVSFILMLCWQGSQSKQEKRKGEEQGNGGEYKWEERSLSDIVATKWPALLLPVLTLLSSLQEEVFFLSHFLEWQSMSSAHSSCCDKHWKTQTQRTILPSEHWHMLSIQLSWMWEGERQQTDKGKESDRSIWLQHTDQGGQQNREKTPFGWKMLWARLTRAISKARRMLTFSLPMHTRRKKQIKINSKGMMFQILSARWAVGKHQVLYQLTNILGNKAKVS